MKCWFQFRSSNRLVVDEQHCCDSGWDNSRLVSLLTKATIRPYTMIWATYHSTTKIHLIFRYSFIFIYFCSEAYFCYQNNPFDNCLYCLPCCRYCLIKHIPLIIYLRWYDSLPRVGFSHLPTVFINHVVMLFSKNNP